MMEDIKQLKEENQKLKEKIESDDVGQLRSCIKLLKQKLDEQQDIIQQNQDRA